MADALRLFLIGLSYSMILFLIASGLSLIMGVMGILNLAHGSLYMLGAYIGVSVMVWSGSFWLASVLAGLSVGVIGLVLERGFLRRLYKQFNEQVLLTLGFVYIFSNLALIIWGPYQKMGTAPQVFAQSVSIGRLGFPTYRLFLIALGIVVALGLWLFQERTRAGAIVRAGMDDRDMTMAMGVNYTLMCTAIFALGAFLAGCAGLVGAPITGAKWDMGFSTLLLALIVVVVGGVGRVQGTFVGALLIGLIDSYGKRYFPDLAMFTIYGVFILVLLVRPAGLLGRVQIGGGAAPPPMTGAAPRRKGASRFATHPSLDRGIRYLPLVVVVALLLFLPQVVGAYTRTFMSQVLVYSIFAVGLNVMFGFTGLFSLGHAAFYGVAAYTVGILMTKLGVTSFWVVLPLGVLVGVLAAVLFGVIALRVSGVYFLFVTLALSELLVAVAQKWVGLTGGSNGLVAIGYPNLGFGAMNASRFYYVILAVFVLSMYVLRRLIASPFGLALQGVRDDELRMRHLGYNTWVYKFAAFVVAGLFAAVAGVLAAPSGGTVVPTFLGTATSTLVVLMVIIGSSRYLFGPALGVTVVLGLQYFVSLWMPERWPLVLGAVFVATVMFLPGGMGVYLVAFWNRVRYRRIWVSGLSEMRQPPDAEAEVS